MDLALYGCMTSIHDDAVRRCPPGESSSLPFRYLGCATSLDGPARLLSQRNRGAAAGPGYSDTAADALVRDGALRAEAAAR